MTSTGQEHLTRLRTLMAQRGYDAVIIRNNPDLRWLTGAVRVLDDEEAHTAVITADGAYLHTDSRYYNAFDTQLGKDSGWTLSLEANSSSPHQAWVASMLAEKKCRVVAIEESASIGFVTRLKQALYYRSIDCLLPVMHGDIAEMRAVKSAEEIEALKAAQAITDEAFEYMCSAIRPGKTELQLRAELDNYMLTHGADSLSFDTIVASGPNTANPHAQPSNRVVQEGDFVLMDFGAGLKDYKSDMTRTVVVGTPNEGQRDLYDLVRRVNESCEAFLRPGIKGREAHEHAVKLITEAGFGDYFKHGLGHGVGIQIHEEPRLSASDAHVLAEGNVVTVEPGVYLPGLGGVRLEDYGVITKDGYEVFTHSPHDLQVIKA